MCDFDQIKKWACLFQYFSTVSNAADEGEEDKSDNKG